jgi:UDP-N-acetylmuramoylalanine--D-glutamate ligase
VPLTHPEPHWSVKLAQAAGAEIIGDTELFERERALRAKGSRLVAITGTNGKSTTTALITHILADAGVPVAMGGNIGLPILALDDVMETMTYVVEYSSYQIDLTPSLTPDVGLLLNLSPDHIDRHGSFEHYAEVKAGLAKAAAKKGIAVIGADDAESRRIAADIEKSGGRVLQVSTLGPVERGVFAEEGRLFQVFGDSIHEVADLAGISSLRGAHNWQNAAAAFAACRALGVAPHEIARALSSFPGLAHRMEEVRRIGKVLFVNDSKATNADAAARSLAAFEPIYWIAGGQAKSGGIEPLAPYFPRIAHAYLIGEAAEIFGKTLNGKVPFTISGDLDSAVAAAAAAARQSPAEEPVVLLAPACASFDQFANFEARGWAFREAVERL